MNNLDTTHEHNYQYLTEHLEIHFLGGVKVTKLETLRITLAVQKPGQHNVLRHSLDLYNDNQVEKLVRKIAERPGDGNQHHPANPTGTHQSFRE